MTNQIKLVNMTRQLIRTQLYKAGKIGKSELEIALAPKETSIIFPEELLTPIAKTQIKKKFLRKIVVTT